MRCPWCLHAGVKDEEQGLCCGPAGQPAPGTWSWLVVQIADMGDGWKCFPLSGQPDSAVKVTSWGKAQDCDKGLCIPAQGLLQRSTSQAFSSPALLGSSFQESCWVSAESQVSGRNTGMAKLGTEHYHPHSFSPPAPCSACSHAVK